MRGWPPLRPWAAARAGGWAGGAARWWGQEQAPAPRRWLAATCLHDVGWFVGPVRRCPGAAPTVSLLSRQHVVRM